MRDPIDFHGLNDFLLQRVDTLLLQWLPGGIERNGRWYVGDFDGQSGESANVNMQTGQWIDNAAPDQEKGGDLISLYARVRGLNNGQAARELMQQMGLSRPEPDRAPRHVQASAPAPRAASAPDDADPAPWSEAQPQAMDRPAPVREAKRRTMWRAVVPVPAHAPAPSFRWGYRDKKHNDAWVELEAVRTWAYAFEGVLYGHVARFERTSSEGEIVKDTLPLTWCVDESDDRGTSKWHWKQWDAPRPLYVPAGALAPMELKRTVVLVEGEKCAQAGRELLGDEFDFVSWPGGCKAWSYAAWGWLMGRTVVLWPDCDAQHERLTKEEREQGVDPKTKPLRDEKKQPGVQAMVGIGALLQADYGCAVSLAKIPKPGAVGDGWDIADAIAQGWTADQVRAFILDTRAFVAPSDEQRAKVAGQTPSIAGAGEDEDARDAWRKWLMLTDKGTIKPVRENLVLAIDGVPEKGVLGIPEAAGVIAFNEFTNDVVKLRDTPWGTKAGVWDEVDELELGNWLSREHWLPSMGRQTLEEAVVMVSRRHKFHPAREKFERLRGQWDGEKRLGQWLERCCCADTGDTTDQRKQYLARVGTWLVMAIAARVLTPGIKFDYMTIFEGGQGMGKSTLAQILGGDWFSDTGLVLGDKDSYQNIQGILVYEWGELDSLSKAEVTKVKQFISSRKDRFRASFDRRPKDYPRQVVFIGTTNERHYLTDPTGNRRMWPVLVSRFIDLAWVRENLDQMFAESLVYLDAGERFHPTPKEQADLFEPEQNERTVENALESAIRKYLYDDGQRVGMHQQNGALVKEVSLSELLTALGISVDKQTAAMSKQASAALGRLGWERGRSSKSRANASGDMVRPWVYLRPRESVAGAVSSASEFNGSMQSQQPEGAFDDCPL